MGEKKSEEYFPLEGWEQGLTRRGHEEIFWGDRNYSNSLCVDRGLGYTGGLTKSDQRASFFVVVILLPDNGLTDTEKEKIRTNTVLLDWNQQ